MNYYNKTKFMNILSNSIKKFRKLNNLSQKELAKGICSQAQLSNIENCVEVPNSFILYSLCKKLGISLEQLMNDSHSEHYKQVEEIVYRYEELTFGDDDDSVIEKYVESQKDFLLAGTKYDICLYYFGKLLAISTRSIFNSHTKADVIDAQKNYNEALKNGLANYDLLYFRYIATMLVISIRTFDFNEGLSYIHKASQLVDKFSVKSNHKALIGFYVNTAIIYNYLGNFDIAKDYVDKIIDKCQNHGIVHGLDNAYMVMAFQHNPSTKHVATGAVRNKEMAEFYINKAIEVCKIMSKSRKIEFYNKEIEKLRKIK